MNTVELSNDDITVVRNALVFYREELIKREPRVDPRDTERVKSYHLGVAEHCNYLLEKVIPSDVV